MRVKISKRQVDALTPGGLIADEEVRGFVARKLASDTSPFDYGPDPRHIAAAAAAVAAVVNK